MKVVYNQKNFGIGWVLLRGGREVERDNDSEVQSWIPECFFLFFLTRGFAFLLRKIFP